MVAKADFSNEEWSKLMEAPVLAGLGISLLDMGVVSFARELAALVGAVLAARSDYPDNPLVQAVASEFEARKEGSDAAPPPEQKTPDTILAELAHVAALVDTKAGGREAHGFKAFLFGVSEKVAAASGSGLFGFGEKVSDDEKAFLSRLKQTLALS